MTPGNLGTLVRFFRDHGREHSYGDAWHVVASQLSAWPDWVRGSVVRNIYSGALDLSGATPIAVCGAACSSAPACSPGDEPRTRSGSTCWSCSRSSSAFVSVSRIVGDIFPYLVTWTWAVGMLTWLAIAWSVVRWWQTREAHRSRGSAGSRSASSPSRSSSCRGEHRRRGDARATPTRSGPAGCAASPPRCATRCPPGDGVVEIRGGTTPGSAWIGAGIADELEHDGIDTRVVARPRRSPTAPTASLDGEQRATRRAAGRGSRARRPPASSRASRTSGGSTSSRCSSAMPRAPRAR